MLSDETISGNSFNLQPTTAYGPAGLAYSYVDSNGDVHFNKTGTSNEGTGTLIRQDGQIISTRDGGAVLNLNRLTSDGPLLNFLKDDVVVGDIRTAAGVVTLTAFMGSHYTEFAGAAPEIGTIMETAPGLVGRRLAGQARLPRAKVSDTIASPAVYGVYLGPDTDEDGTGNIIDGHYIAALGAAWVRVTAGPVQLGDLIESAGDGAGRVQADAIMRSSTVAKITSVTPKTVYPDGSRLLPCTLHCG